MARDIPMPHPGTILRHEFLEPMGLSVYALSRDIEVSRGRMNEIMRGESGITASIAVRLGRFFSVDPQWFMNMQAKYDLAIATEALAEKLERIKPRPLSAA